MALEIRQNLKLTQTLIMTQKLQQAIKLLQLSRMELVGEIQQVLETNPVLEDAQYEEMEPTPTPEEVSSLFFPATATPLPRRALRKKPRHPWPITGTGRAFSRIG